MELPSGTDPHTQTGIRQRKIIAKFGQEALDTVDIDKLLHDASIAVREGLDTEYVTVLEVASSDEVAVLREGIGWCEDRIGSTTVRTDDESYVGYSLQTEGPVILDDFRTETRFTSPDLLTDHDIVSGISVVIGSSENPWGLLETQTTEHRDFTDQDAAFVQSIASILASAIDTSRTRHELEEIYGRISDAFFALDEDWRFTYLNEQAHDVINPDGRELEGKNVWEEFPAATERKFKPKYEQAMYDQETVSFEEYYPEPLDAWFEVRAYPSQTGLSVYFRDITDRRECERQLRESERRFRTLAESFPNGGIHYFDEDLRYQYVSGSGFDPIDTSPEDLVGKTIYEVDPYSEEDIELLEPLMESTLDGNEETMEIPYEGRVFEVHSVPLRDDTGSVTGGFFISQDITEQHRRQRKLEARSAAIAASTDGIAILDGDGTYMYVNQAHADIYGYDSPDAFGGNSWQMCYGERERERFEIEVMPTLNAEGQWRGEAIGTREDGTTFPQELSLSVTDDGRVICVVRDISERKERERQLARQNERLEEFTSVVSHDLRAPLSVANGRLELAREECDSPHLAKARQSIDRAIDLVEDLRALAREGAVVGAVESIELAVVAEEAWETIETAEATLTIERNQKLRADRSRVRQLFENLFRNAVEHGGEAVSVRVGWEEGGLYVADDGSGIPPEDRDTVFEAGYSTAESGTGYGLNIVSEIVAAHDWEITVTESDAGGARFEITGVETPAD
jgi:PAS domain S-box-containing protein